MTTSKSGSCYNCLIIGFCLLDFAFCAHNFCAEFMLPAVCGVYGKPHALLKIILPNMDFLPVAIVNLTFTVTVQFILISKMQYPWNKFYYIEIINLNFRFVVHEFIMVLALCQLVLNNRTDYYM